MATTVFKTLRGCAAAALLTTVVVACSTAPGQQQAASSEGHIRSWADWATIPGNAPPEDALFSNAGEGGN